MTSNPIAFASSTRDKQSRNVDPRSPRPSAERGKNSYHAANKAAWRSTTTRGAGAYCAAAERSGYVAISTSNSPDFAMAWIFTLAAEEISSENSRNRTASARSRARLAAASTKAAPSRASLRKSEMPPSNFFANSLCQLRKVSVHASTVYS